MRGRIPLFALLASSLTFLASLFLPWRETTLPSSGGVQELLNQFSGDGREYDGWVTGVGDVAVLLVVAIVVATIVALRRPQLAARLPIGRLAVALGYFAVALAVTVHMLSELFLHAFTGRPASTHASWTYGVYLGLASAGIALVSGLAYRRSDLLRPREAADVGGLCSRHRSAHLVSVAVGRATGPDIGTSIHGIEGPTAAIAALGLILGARMAARRTRTTMASAASRSRRRSSPGRRPAHVAVRRCTQVWDMDRHCLCGRARCARGRTGVAAAMPGSASRVDCCPYRSRRPSDRGALPTLAGAPRPTAQTVRFNGWYPVSRRRCRSAVPAGPRDPSPSAHSRATCSTWRARSPSSSRWPGPRYRADTLFYRIGYGAIVGFAAAGVLLVTAIVPFRRGSVDGRRALARAAPLAPPCSASPPSWCPWWYVLPQNWTSQASSLYGWLGVPGVLLALYLVPLVGSPDARAARERASRLTVVPLMPPHARGARAHPLPRRPEHDQWGAIDPRRALPPTRRVRLGRGEPRPRGTTGCPRRSGGSTGYPKPRARARGSASTTSLATRP